LTDEDQVLSETLITLTSDIVAAHVSSNKVAVDDVPALIGNVYGALAGLGGGKRPEADRPEPAVPIRNSVHPDHVVCLECGRELKILKRHLATGHGLSTSEYRQRWGLSAEHPLVAPKYAAKRRALAKKIGLGRQPGQKRGRKKKA
jgi:predicted transcriptional regulator